MEDLVQLFTVLSEPVRLQLLGRLASGEQCVCKLYGALGLPQSTVSRHLGLLRLTGIVTARRKGTWMHYRLATEQWPEEWQPILDAAIKAAAARSVDQIDPIACVTVSDREMEAVA
jgi:ArsR family transcriptional regulator, arsenate/arsenite/antimonite-responsive transcriptional repressor